MINEPRASVIRWIILIIASIFAIGIAGLFLWSRKSDLLGAETGSVGFYATAFQAIILFLFILYNVGELGYRVLQLPVDKKTCSGAIIGNVALTLSFIGLEISRHITQPFE